MSISEPFPVNMELRVRWVLAIYLRLLHANFIREAEEEARGTRQAILAATHGIGDDEIRTLLEEREWRGRLSAGWFVGLGRRANFIPLVAERLLASEMTYSGQGYCLALGLIGGDEARHHLRTYLETYLPLRGRVYDQQWAIGALAHLEGAAPATFLDPYLWCEGDFELDPQAGISSFSRIVEYLRRHGMIAMEV